jgi:hypothetical protein
MHAIFGWLSITKIRPQLRGATSAARSEVRGPRRASGSASSTICSTSHASFPGKLVLAEQPVELTAVVPHHRGRTRGPATAAAKGITLACESGISRCVVIGDEAGLFQVLGNLPAALRSQGTAPDGGKIQRHFWRGGAATRRSG